MVVTGLIEFQYNLSVGHQNSGMMRNPTRDNLDQGKLFREVPMTGQYDEATWLLADILRTTTRSELDTDALAETQLREVLRRLSTMLSQAHGQILHTMEQALLCAFSDANRAFKISCDIQHAFAGEPFRLRIGLHSGPIPRDENGQSSAEILDFMRRLISFACAGQILMTEASVQRLHPSLRRNVQYLEDRFGDGGQGVIPLYQVIWRQEDITFVSNAVLQSFKKPSKTSLCLRWRDRRIELDPDCATFTLGRSNACDLMIDSEFVSRQHACIEFHQTNFVLIDQSTNGTYVLTDDDQETFLHHEEIILRGKGIISLGRSIAAAGSKLIYFSAES